MNDLEPIALKPGQIVSVRGKLYGRCFDCHSIVRVDKWLFGSLHYCVAGIRKGMR